MALGPAGGGHVLTGAAADKGDVTWTKAGGTLTITGVTLNGLGGLPVTITVHSAYGHYSTDVVSVFPSLAAAGRRILPGASRTLTHAGPRPGRLRLAGNGPSPTTRVVGDGPLRTTRRGPAEGEPASHPACLRCGY